MYYEVYIDSLFSMNVMLNLMMLSLTAKILKCTATHLSLLLGAIFGSASVCLLILLLPLPLWLRLFIAYGIVSILMVRIGLRAKTFELLYRGTIALYFLSFAFGGMMEFASNQLAYFGIRKTTIIGTIFVGYLSWNSIRLAISKFKGMSIKQIYEVNIRQDGKELSVSALVDTGNGLYEPISGKPVSIIEKKVLEQYQVEIQDKNFRIIPYHSIGKENGMLRGFQADKLTIQNEELSIVCEKAILGIYEGKLSVKNKYQMILHPKLLEK